MLARAQLQALVRGETARSLCHLARQVLAWEAATRIQAHLRGKNEIDSAAQLKAHSARAIQAGLTGMLDRGIVELGLERVCKDSVEHIMAAERGRKAREEVRWQREELRHYEAVADDSARTLQAGLLVVQARGVAKNREAAAMVDEARCAIDRDQARVDVRERAHGILRGREARVAVLAIAELQERHSVSYLLALAKGFQDRDLTRRL